jgi:hypothetical protein
MGILPAIYAARRLSNPARLGALRKESGVTGSDRQAETLSSAVRRGLGEAHLAPLAALGLGLPIYTLVAILAGLHSSSWDAPLGSALVCWLDGAMCVAASVALGAAVAGRRSGRAAVRALLYSLLFTGLRIALMLLIRSAVMADMQGNKDWCPLDTLRVVAYADIVFCGLIALVLDAVALARLRRLLLPAPPPSPEDQFLPGSEVCTATDAHVAPAVLSHGARRGEVQVIRGHKERMDRSAPLTPEELAGAGLDVSAWSLLKWRFWRDPLFRAERRHLWSGRRILALWVVLPFVSVGLYALNQLIWLGLSKSGTSSMVFSRWSVVTGLVGALTSLISACVPMLFIAALTSIEKNGAVFESMAVTPLTPLRLAAARFLGKIWHLVIAWAVLGTASFFVSPLVMGHWGSGLPYWHTGQLIVAPSGILCSAARALMLAAVGMLFAARQRTLVGAAIASLATALGLLLTSSLLLRPLWGSYSYQDPYAGLYMAAQTLPLNVAYTILYTILAGMFLAGAARHMTLRRENAE